MPQNTSSPHPHRLARCLGLLLTLPLAIALAALTWPNICVSLACDSDAMGDFASGEDLGDGDGGSGSGCDRGLFVSSLVASVFYFALLAVVMGATLMVRLVGSSNGQALPTAKARVVPEPIFALRMPEMAVEVEEKLPSSRPTRGKVVEVETYDVNSRRTSHRDAVVERPGGGSGRLSAASGRMSAAAGRASGWDDEIVSNSTEDSDGDEMAPPERPVGMSAAAAAAAGQRPLAISRRDMILSREGPRTSVAAATPRQLMQRRSEAQPRATPPPAPSATLLQDDIVSNSTESESDEPENTSPRYSRQEELIQRESDDTAPSPRSQSPRFSHREELVPRPSPRLQSPRSQSPRTSYREELIKRPRGTAAAAAAAAAPAPAPAPPPPGVADNTPFHGSSAKARAAAWDVHVARASQGCLAGATGEQRVVAPTARGERPLQRDESDDG